MAVMLETSPGFIIFFDDQHVQRFVKSWNVSMGCNGTPSTATISMVYCEALANFEYLTDVKIFMKNVFSGRYRMIFDGQLHGRDVSVSGRERNITYSATDHMYWLTKTPLPMHFGMEERIDPVVTMSWLANGINFDKVKTALTAGQSNFEGMNLETMIKEMFKIVNEATFIHAGHQKIL